jgi:hypothetical protein
MSLVYLYSIKYMLKVFLQFNIYLNFVELFKLNIDDYGNANY